MARTIYLTWTSKWDGIWFKNHPAIWMLSLGYIQLSWYRGDVIKDLADYQKYMVNKGMPKFCSSAWRNKIENNDNNQQMFIQKKENQKESLVNTCNDSKAIDKIPERFGKLRLEVIKAQRDRKEEIITISMHLGGDEVLHPSYAVFTIKDNTLWIYMSESESPDKVSICCLDLKFLGRN